MANLQFIRPLPRYYGKGLCCEPDPACLPVPIPKWPTVDEYNNALKVAIGNFAQLTAQLGQDYMLGTVKLNHTLANAKKAWIWFYALNSFNPLIFSGNILSAEAFWAIAMQVYDMKKSCGGAAKWQSWG